MCWPSCPDLLGMPENAFIPLSPECASARAPSQQAPYFSDTPEIPTSIPRSQQGCERLAAESHIAIQVAFQVSCFSRLHSDSFSGLTSKDALLSSKRRRVGIYIFNAYKEPPQILHFLCSILFCLSELIWVLVSRQFLLLYFLLALSGEPRAVPRKLLPDVLGLPLR